MLLAVLIIALALDVALIVQKTRQSNPEPDTGVTKTETSSGIGSSMIFNFSGAVNNTGSDSSSSSLDGLSEEEIGRMALEEESGSEL